MKAYELHSRVDFDFVSRAHPTWQRQEVWSKLGCHRCHSLLPSVYPTPVDAWIEIPSGRSIHNPVTLVAPPCPLGLISMSLLDHLKDVLKDFAIGHVYYGADRALLASHRTWHGPVKRRIPQWGGAQSRYGQCEYCGRRYEIAKLGRVRVRLCAINLGKSLTGRGVVNI
jgi:hypothetical protein